MGKTTLARQLATRLGVEHVELDALYHQPGWTELPAGEFARRMAERLDAAAGGWVTCGNYNTQGGSLNQDRADTIVWLDLPRWLVMTRVVRRTLRRLVTREELWNGNREPWSNIYSLDPEKNIVVWTWVNHPDYRASYGQKWASGAWDHARVVHLRSRRAIAEWLATA